MWRKKLYRWGKNSRFELQQYSRLYIKNIFCKKKKIYISFASLAGNAETKDRR